MAVKITVRQADALEQGPDKLAASALEQAQSDEVSLVFDSVLLPPQSPRVLRSGDLVRVGRVWLEIRIDPLLIANANPTSAKALALGLITRALATQGEDGSPRIMVTEGPDAGKSLDVHDVTRRYVVGRSPDGDLVLEDETAARRHIELGVKGDSLVVKDLGSTSANLGTNVTHWQECVGV